MRDGKFTALYFNETIMEIIDVLGRDKFLDVALSGDADCLVSGDLDLISMKPYRSILLTTPAEFVAMI